MENFNVEISAEGKPTVTRTLRELEAQLRKVVGNPSSVDIALLTLDMSGQASIIVRGMKLNFKRIR